ncbi:MAG: large subunit ribosomal protein [Miltoncostaeaceae bacterium]|jgi:large subunit ribosomal protein L6|nr:large subunit ribosomal protein [Miltoncostaeaceae bacterium]
MSRIGRAPIPVPDGVTVDIRGQHVRVEGPRGNLERTLPEPIRISQTDGVLNLTRPTDRGPHRALHGLSRTLVANMVQGVTQGFEKRLEIVGVGYRAQARGEAIEIAVGFSHPVHIQPPPGISLEVPAPTQVVVRGIDKQAVGQVAATIRAVRPPEPYKGKGIRYAGEIVPRKVGKRS